MVEGDFIEGDIRVSGFYDNNDVWQDVTTYYSCSIASIELDGHPSIECSIQQGPEILDEDVKGVFAVQPVEKLDFFVLNSDQVVKDEKDINLKSLEIEVRQSIKKIAGK